MKSILFLFFLLVSSFSFATHIIGGELYYDNLGNGNYRITLEVYRDCFNGQAEFDNPLQFTVFNTDGSIFNVYNFNLISQTILPYETTDFCVIPPTDFCVELGFYSDTINLPISTTGYILAYSRCCWSHNILNIQNPNDNGITLTSFIPPSSIINSNPRYVNYPPLILCANRLLNFNHIAQDPDGDSLVYKIITPFSGGSPLNPVPNPEPPPPFPISLWETGFSESLPFGSNSSVKIDSLSGLLTFYPSLLGNFVLAVEVSEYRNGILISTKSRTFGYRVVSCQFINPIVVTIEGTVDQIEGCGEAMFIINRNNADSPLTVEVNMSGTAINGTDYVYIPQQITIPASAYKDTINLISIFDNLSENTESVGIEIIIISPCDETDIDTVYATLNILNYEPMVENHIPFYEICDQESDGIILFTEVNGGIPPYQFNWNNNSFPDNDSISISSSELNPHINIFNLSITDQCEKTINLEPIVVDNQCALEVPNIITINADGINEFFLIKNLEDFDQVRLNIFNRWGNLVYENPHYLNDWNGVDQYGNYLHDGVYFYRVEASVTENYLNKTKKDNVILHGFVQIVRNKN